MPFILLLILQDTFDSAGAAPASPLDPCFEHKKDYLDYNITCYYLCSGQGSKGLHSGEIENTYIVPDILSDEMKLVKQHFIQQSKKTVSYAAGGDFNINCFNSSIDSYPKCRKLIESADVFPAQKFEQISGTPLLLQQGS